MSSAIPRETPFSRAAPSHEEFIARLNAVEKIVNSDNLLLNEDLGATKKGGFHWIVRVIMSPLSYLFCRDPFSDVKINRVAQKLEEYLRVNQQHFASTDSSREVKAISDRIIARLDERTHNRYHAVLDRVLKQPNDRLAGLERADADAAQRAAWTTELNGLRDTVARVESQQNGNLQGLQNQQAGLQTDLNKLRGELGELRQVVGRNRNPQNGTLQELRNQQANLREEFNWLRGKLGELSRTVAGNQNPQSGELQGLRELQEEFNGLRGDLEKLGQTVAGNHSSHNGELQELREQQAGLQIAFQKLGGVLGELKQTVAENQNSQNEALQTGLEGLRKNLEELKQAVAEAQNPQNSGELQELREEQARLQIEVRELKNEINDLVDLIEEESNATKRRIELIIEEKAELIGQSLSKQSAELDNIRKELEKTFDGLYGEAVELAHIVRDLGARTENLELQDKADAVSRKFVSMGLCRSFVVLPPGVSILNAGESSVIDNSGPLEAASKRLSSLAQKMKEKEKSESHHPPPPQGLAEEHGAHAFYKLPPPSMQIV